MSKFENELFRKDYTRETNLKRLETIFDIFNQFDKEYIPENLYSIKEYFIGALYNQAVENNVTSKRTLNGFMKKEEEKSVLEILNERLKDLPPLFVPEFETSIWSPAGVFVSKRPVECDSKDPDFSVYKSYLHAAYYNAEYKYANATMMNRFIKIFFTLLEESNFNFAIASSDLCFLKESEHLFEMLMFSSLLNDTDITTRCQMTVTSKYLYYCEKGYLQQASVMRMSNFKYLLKKDQSCSGIVCNPVYILDDEIKLIHFKNFTEELSKLTF